MHRVFVSCMCTVCSRRGRPIAYLWGEKNEKMAKQSLVEVYEEVSKVLCPSPNAKITHWCNQYRPWMAYLVVGQGHRFFLTLSRSLSFALLVWCRHPSLPLSHSSMIMPRLLRFHQGPYTQHLHLELSMRPCARHVCARISLVTRPFINLKKTPGNLPEFNFHCPGIGSTNQISERFTWQL